MSDFIIVDKLTVYKSPDDSYTLADKLQAKKLLQTLLEMEEEIQRKQIQIDFLKDRADKMQNAGEGLWAFMQNPYAFSKETKHQLSLDWVQSKMLKKQK